MRKKILKISSFTDILLKFKKSPFRKTKKSFATSNCIPPFNIKFVFF